MKTLQAIFDKNKCDKGSARHRYDRVYEPNLKHLKDKDIKLLEIGIYKGDSLRSWLDFLPKASISGIDIFGRVAPNKIPILSNDRVSWCKCDSIKGPNDEFKAMAGDIKYDVIIDDGLHTLDAQRQTFKNFIPYLNDGGVYFIEDVWPLDKMTKEDRQHRWIKTNRTEYTDKKYKALLETIKEHDTIFHDIRSGYHPDTYIIEIRKKALK